MAKRRKRSGSHIVSTRKQDRISGLPIHLLHHILSFLQIHTVVQTCLLAKSWRNVWRSASTVYLAITDTPDFSQFVDSVLKHRDDGSDIHTFSLFLYPDYRSKFRRWLEYVVTHNVKVLHLSFRSDFDFTLISNSETLTKLKLFGCFSSTCFLSPPKIFLPMLQTLHLDQVIFSGEVQLSMFSSIPSLETLIIEYCKFYNYMASTIISSHQLKKVVVKGDCPGLKISTPNLNSIHLDLNLLSFPIIDFNGMVVCMPYARINIPPPATSEAMIQLFKLLYNARSLTLSPLFLSSIAAKVQEEDPSVLKCIQAPFRNLTSLKVETSFCDSEILVLNTLLEHSPEIHTVILENHMGKDYCQDNATEQHLEEENVWFEHELNVEFVEIQGFRGTDNEVRFAKFFIEYAEHLRSLIITTCKSEEEGVVDGEKMMEIREELLTYSAMRGGSTVRMIFH